MGRNYTKDSLRGHLRILPAAHNKTLASTRINDILNKLQRATRTPKSEQIALPREIGS